MSKTVLFISFFHPEIVRGGAQQVAYELFNSARKDPETNAVLLCACDPVAHKDLLKSGAFITGFDGRDNEFLFFGHGYDYFYHRATNPLAMTRFREFLEEVNPDVIHFHHCLLIGINAVSIARKTCPNAKILYTFHEFVPICHAHGQMVRTGKNGLCTNASQYRCHECFPDTAPDSFWAKKEWMLSHFELVDTFITPTTFVKDRYVEWGIPEDKIRVITNGQDNLNRGDFVSTIKRDRKSHNRFAFFGQVLNNKGPHVLLEAAEILLKKGIDDFYIDIYGGNIEYSTKEYREKINTLIDNLDELEFDKLAWRGRYDYSQLPLLMEKVDWVVVPSVWWEIFGLVVSEAWMFGKPVIASNIGGLRERISESGGGLLFNTGDPEDLAAQMEQCISEPELWTELHNNTKPPASAAEAWNMHKAILQ